MIFKTNISDKNNSLSTIVARAIQKDTLALKYLYDNYAKQMLNTSYRITKNMQDAEDLVQEAFITSFQKLDTLKDPKTYGGWLKRIVVNSSIKHAKSYYSHIDIQDEAVESEDDNDQWYSGISFEVINQAILRLPDGCREILCLYLLEDYKHREIGELLEISISNSKSQYRYALKLLKNDLMKLKPNV